MKVVNDQIGSLTYTHDLVNAVIGQIWSLWRWKAFGIYHLTNWRIVGMTSQRRFSKLRRWK
jgi:dTDP-4-dehydrorhamnose reductase